MESVEEDRSAIQEDIKAEQILEKELQELEKEADRLDDERARRLAPLTEEPPSEKTDRRAPRSSG